MSIDIENDVKLIIIIIWPIVSLDIEASIQLTIIISCIAGARAFLQQSFFEHKQLWTWCFLRNDFFHSFPEFFFDFFREVLFIFYF